MENTTVLVVWEKAPEGIDFYLLLVPETILPRFLDVHGKISNLSGNTDADEDAIEWVSKYLADYNPLVLTEALTLPAGAVVVHTGVFL